MMGNVKSHGLFGAELSHGLFDVELFQAARII